jgi:hypothetical protein
MVVVNFGIIARQRIFLFPFLFVFFEAISREKGAAATGIRTRPELTPVGSSRLDEHSTVNA